MPPLSIRMKSLTSKRFVFLSVVAFFGTTINGEVIQHKIRERTCIPLNNCGYYRQLLGETIVGLTKESIYNDIKRQTCNLEEQELDERREGKVHSYFSKIIYRMF